AEQSLAEAQSGAVRARNGVNLAIANLNRLLGRTIDAPATLEPVQGLPPEPASTAELLPEAMRQRPEAVALRARIEAAEAGAPLGARGAGAAGRRGARPGLGAGGAAGDAADLSGGICYPGGSGVGEPGRHARREPARAGDLRCVAGGRATAPRDWRDAGVRG